MEFTKEDFTDDELIFLKLAFNLLDNAVYGMREVCWGDQRNTVYDLKHKLGIYDLLD